MTTIDDRADSPTTGGGGRHRRNDLPPDGILAEAVRVWRSRRGDLRSTVAAVSASASAPQPVAGSFPRD